MLWVKLCERQNLLWWLLKLLCLHSSFRCCAGLSRAAWWGKGSLLGKPRLMLFSKPWASCWQISPECINAVLQPVRIPTAFVHMPKSDSWPKGRKNKKEKIFFLTSTWNLLSAPGPDLAAGAWFLHSTFIRFLKTRAEAESGPWLKKRHHFFPLQVTSHPLTFFRKALSVHHQHEHHESLKKRLALVLMVRNLHV